MDAHQAPVAERDRGIAVSHEAAVHSQQVWQQPNNSHARIEVPAPSVQRLRHSKKRKKVENFSLVQFSNLLTKPNFDFYICNRWSLFLNCSGSSWSNSLLKTPRLLPRLPRSCCARTLSQ